MCKFGVRLLTSSFGTARTSEPAHAIADGRHTESGDDRDTTSDPGSVTAEEIGCATQRALRQGSECVVAFGRKTVRLPDVCRNLGLGPPLGKAAGLEIPDRAALGRERDA